MMFDAQTPQGKVTWLSDLDEPLAGSPIVIVRLKECAALGLQVAWPAEPVKIDLKTPGDVRAALEVLYSENLTFTGDIPESTQFYEPAETGLIY